MIRFLLLGVVILGAVRATKIDGAPDFFDDLDQKDIEACVATSGADLEKFKALMNDPDPKDIDEKIWCFLKCLSEKQGYINPDGTINKEKKMTSKTKGNEEFDAVVDKCMEDKATIKTCSDMSDVHNCIKSKMQ